MSNKIKKNKRLVILKNGATYLNNSYFKKSLNELKIDVLTNPAWNSLIDLNKSQEGRIFKFKKGFTNFK